MQRMITLRNTFRLINLKQRTLYTNVNQIKNSRKSTNQHELIIFHQNFNYLHLCSRLSKEPDSKVDKAFDILKEEASTKPPASTAATATGGGGGGTSSATEISAKSAASDVVQDDNKPVQASSIVPRPTLWQRIVAECKHYYHGFKLLYLETRITIRLLKEVLRGHTLTRRERKQLTQTAADLFRLVPFSLFVIVPFLEFTLPIFLKLFPNMLPSTFKEQSKEQEKLKKQLKAKLEMAKFLQDTLEETALTSNVKVDETGVNVNKKFAEFMRKIRSKGVQPTTDEILKYSSYFENELTLDNLNRQQLIALCQILEVSTYGNIPPNDVLRFQLRMKIRNLEADDKMIIKEGVENLTSDELQQACRDRGMRSMGVAEDRLRKQLEQWLDLHLNRKIPLSLLILSRALYLPENLAPEEMIKSTISALPEAIESATFVKIAEATGSKVDNTVKLELLKREEEAIKLEKEQKVESEKKAAAEAREQLVTPAQEVLVDKAEVLKDKAPKIEIKEEQELLSPKEISDIGKIIENLAVSQQSQVKEDLDELKKDVTEYKQDLKEVEKIVLTEKQIKLTETKSAKILSKRVDKLIKDLDKLVVQVQSEEKAGQGATATTTAKNMVSIDELIAAIHQLQGISSEIKEKKIAQVLESLDKDRDGKIDDLNDVIKVFELIAEENVKVSKDQLGKILTLLEKEKVLELEEQQQQQQQPK